MWMRFGVTITMALERALNPLMGLSQNRDSDRSIAREGFSIVRHCACNENDIYSQSILKSYRWHGTGRRYLYTRRDARGGSTRLGQDVSAKRQGDPPKSLIQ